MKLRNILIAALGATVMAGAAGAASAATPWQAHHRGRVEVNHRLKHLNRSIRVERREHKLSFAQAHRLHAHVHAIRRQERRLARRDGSHLTRQEHVRLNHEETGVRRHIPG
ncbi:MAG TPA: hypothetical protein VGG29_15955 [Caulobacteraceae bacterium]|jgi:hypothetical protein